MDRRLIRKRWQVTIPPGVRRLLNLYVGQLLNWDIVSTPEGETFIRVYTGSCATPEDFAAFQELFGKKKGQRGKRKCRGKIRKLEEKRASKIAEGRPVTGIELIELREEISGLSQFLLNLQDLNIKNLYMAGQTGHNKCFCYRLQNLFLM